jgi:peptidoglycan/LPS O-acetylase OafA/YrhL
MPVYADAEPKSGATQRSIHRRYYRPELDALRFLAFFLVFMCHSMDASWGALGVPVFFLLSAYLITELLLREREATGTVDIKKFYVRRILRIWPLYFGVLLCGYAISRFSGANVFPTPALLSYLLLSGNWYTALHGSLPWGLSPLWSIGIEEQFYLVWPCLILFGGRKGIVIAATALWLICQAVVFTLSYRGAAINPGIWNNSFNQLQYFAIGALISVALNRSMPVIKSWLRFLMVAGGLLIFVFADHLLKITGGVAAASATFPAFLIVGLGATLVLFGFLGCHVSEKLQPIVFLGKISYGLYVFHHIVLAFTSRLDKVLLSHGIRHLNFLVDVLLTLAVTILVAMASYKYFESPFLKLKSRFEVVKSRDI